MANMVARMKEKVPPVQINRTPSPTPKADFHVSVAYDYVAQNNKELTIRSGEALTILDSSRKWWLVRNKSGQQGYVPSTVLHLHSDGFNGEERSSPLT
jgi:hypothetical protein